MASPGSRRGRKRFVRDNNIGCARRGERMRRYGTVILSAAALLLLFWGCLREQGTDKAKFAELIQAGLDLKTAIASGTPCDAPDALIQRLIAGTAALKDKTSSKGEHDLLAAYSDLLTIYKDGLLMCRSRTNPPGLHFVPKGRIYVSQEIDPLVEKYGLSTDRHLYKPTGQYWKSIDADSIQVIWKSAESRIKSIENMVNYN